MIKLSEQQTKVFDEIMKWHQTPKKTFVLAGYAGAGKTTLAKYIANAIGNTHFCAYTGKAANVLREKGCSNATTIHGAIYRMVGDEDDFGENLNAQPKFVLNEDSDIKKARLVIVDEYSMLSNEIIEDLLSLSKKVLFLGDPFQLPPVDGECDLKPDTFITEVHRQALDSPIIRYATDVREGRALSYCNEGTFMFAPRSKIPSQTYYNADQIIVGYNKTRNAWNDRFRKKLGYSGVFPQKGEKLICLRNNHEIGLFNGMIDIASKNSKHIDADSCEISFGDYKDIKIWSGDFKRVKPQPKHTRHLDRFDFGYVITCHKSQGSEFDNVIVYNEPIGREKIDRQRWLYTAITRAKEKCILIDPRGR